MRTAERILLLGGCVVLSFLPGIVGSQFEPGAWYAALDRPPLTPPGWVFPIVWTALYAAMGVALYLYLVAGRRLAFDLGAGLFAGQLVLNGLWSWLFFGLERPGLALVDIALLAAVLAATTTRFGQRRRAAGALLLPYLAWVLFATYLNAAIWWMNVVA